jgi:hypothetical protein
MDDIEKKSSPPVAQPNIRSESDTEIGTSQDVENLNVLGYKAELHRNRSMFTLLFQSLAIAAVRVFIS